MLNFWMKKILVIWMLLYLVLKTLCASIVHDLGGYDELSLTNSAKIVSNQSELLFSPNDLDVQPVAATSIFGGNTVKEATKIF